MITDAVIIMIDIIILAVIIFHSAYTYRREKESVNKKNIVNSGFLKRKKYEKELTEEEKRDIEVLRLIEKYDGTASFGRRDED